MSLSCDVVRDLLPLYHDGVCSEQSCALVEEHLLACPLCFAALEAMDAGTDCPLPPADEAAGLKAVAESLKKKKKRLRRRSVLITLLIVAIGIGGYGLAASVSVPVKSSRLSVEEFYQLSDGRLVLRFESSDRRRVSQVLWGQAEDNSIYVTPYVQLLDLSLGRDRQWEEYIAVNPAPAGGAAAQALRLGSEKDSILLWTPGSQLPAADEQTEALIAAQDARFVPPDSYLAFSYPYETPAPQPVPTAGASGSVAAQLPPESSDDPA